MDTFTISKLAMEVAVRFHLSDFPKDMTAQEIHDALAYAQEGDILPFLVWEPFEHWATSSVADSMWTLAMDIEYAFTNAIPPVTQPTN